MHATFTYYIWLIFMAKVGKYTGWAGKKGKTDRWYSNLRDGFPPFPRLPCFTLEHGGMTGPQKHT